ncbi:hypothetical protein IV498_12545 [Paenarthrobacter sp. Z7-10]|uniref:hypothetical protein n=1 Tax=Paenarthrobacter sp. Z7-10 TaxID=2787635 RepID=UPI0022A9A14B|nr:hypothetical protein [Paenarthrobacter sp. Z7-10]MCZ2403986.1 hypothetical protein [Paenarthrobacter sp. Z7-10]
MQTHRSALRIITVSVVVAGALSGCSAGSQPSAPHPAAPSSSPVPEVNPAGDIPDNQAYIKAGAPSGDYTLQVPEGWAEVRKANSLTFTEKLNSISVQESHTPSAPTVQSVGATQVPALAASVPDFSLLNVAPFKRNGGSGILITYTGSSAPDAVTHKSLTQAFERYLFFSHGTIAALTLAGAKGADNVDPWAKVSGSFRWTK